ncbi:hypothetical protein H4J50_16370 [Colwellia sp. 6M3]|jgi:hypothetical protein|uniref:hypothetical protein n=1 Tax=Colwellia sp. 6M3 TaxID=2759849 RepID=UPI0015F5240E|nr:hypothetical protein [Colwellia sp. 6M3]MBA6417586.1 hypothetical protein [Colwellia sp. 6M3]
MKHTFNILLITLISLLNYGCASSAPDSYRGATKSYDADYFDNNDSIEFKYAFRYLMPVAERTKFENTLQNSNYKSTEWTSKMQSEGFNALAISATGTGAFSADGQAAGLALSLVDDYLTGRSEKREFDYMVFSDEWLGGSFTDPDKAHEVAKQKTLNALIATAKEFDYEMVCKSNCDKRMSVFELISTNQSKYIGQYHPEKLSVVLYLSELTALENNAIEKKVFSKDSSFVATEWKIQISSYKTDFSYKVIQVPEVIQNSFKQLTYEIPEKAFKIHKTPFGRKFFRQLSSRLDNWVMVDATGAYELALINGQLYNPVNESSARRFKGAKTTEY